MEWIDMLIGMAMADLLLAALCMGVYLRKNLI